LNKRTNNTISSSGTLASANMYRLSSKEWTGNWSLYYFGYRFYDPNLQRWLNRDPLQEEGGVNLYCFVDNNPVNAFDPSGLFKLCTPYAKIPCGKHKCYELF